MTSRWILFAFAVLSLTAASGARAQDSGGPIDTAPAGSADPAPAAPAIPPPPLAVIAPPPAPRAEPLVLISPGETRPVEAAPTSQLFVSPMGEPFRAGLEAEYPAATWFARVDADADGTVSQDEFIADARAFFARVDANADGQIDGFEDTDYETRIAPEVSAAGLSAGGGPSRKRRKLDPTGAARFGLLPEPQPVRSADANLDFKVTAAEWDGAAMLRFGRLDLDHDGRLTRTEIPQTFEQVKIAKAKEEAAKARPTPPSPPRS